MGPRTGPVPLEDPQVCEEGGASPGRQYHIRTTSTTTSPGSQAQTVMRAPNEATLTALCRAALDRGDTASALAYGAQLEALCAPPAPVPLLSAALWYAAKGLRVFPLRPGGKQPERGSRGCLDATDDADRIAAWWRASPDANVGIATGYLVDVIDIDGPVGVKSWAEEDLSLPPILGTVSTPRAGGSHLYVPADPDRRNRANVEPGIDIRALGGYVVAPPSIGPGGVRYRWRRPLDIGDAEPMLVAA